MRKLLFVLLVLAISGLIFTSCSFDPNHTIRVKNLYSEPFSNVSINSTSYGKVDVGSTTDYKSVDEGSFTLSGTTVTSKTSLSGSGTVTGKGTHKWTLVITSSGGVTISEDKY